MNNRADSIIQTTDLNLLKVLNALLIEQSTTRAAERLGLSQSAVSHALSRLRHMFDDALFIRERGRLVSTPFADSLAAATETLLNDAASLLSSSDKFDPETSGRHFRIGMPEYANTVVLPDLIADVRLNAPAISLDVRTTNSLTVLDDLAQNKFSIAVCVLPHRVVERHIETVPLFADTLKCTATPEHELWTGPLTLERYLSFDHLEVARDPNVPGWLEEALARKGMKRTIGLKMQTFDALADLVRSSGLIATEPARLLIPAITDMGLRMEDPPFEAPNFMVSLVYHRRVSNDAGYAWMIDCIHRLFAGRHPESA